MNQIWFISANVWRNPKYPHPEFFSKKIFLNHSKPTQNAKKTLKKKKKKDNHIYYKKGSLASVCTSKMIS
jgi:hypothetical protein